MCIRDRDCIPITAIYDDGIFRVGKDKYSKSFKFTDINYAVASREDKEAMFLEYSEPVSYTHLHKRTQNQKGRRTVWAVSALLL